MSSSSISSGGSNKGCRSCYCGVRASLLTSGTDDNPGRRFFACPKYPDPARCKYFEWLDDPICKRGKFIILRQRDKIVSLENEIKLLKDNAKLLEDKAMDFDNYEKHFHKMSQMYERKIKEAKAMERKYWFKSFLVLVVVVVGCMAFGKMKTMAPRRDLQFMLPR